MCDSDSGVHGIGVREFGGETNIEQWGKTLSRFVVPPARKHARQSPTTLNGGGSFFSFSLLFVLICVCVRLCVCVNGRHHEYTGTSGM